MPRPAACRAVLLAAALGLLAGACGQQAGDEDPAPPRAARDPAEVTRDRLVLLAAAVRAYHLEAGHLPDALDVLAQRDPRTGIPRLPNPSLLLDGWGRPFRLRTLDAREGRFEIRSPGPDGEFGTEDDLVGPDGEGR